LIQAYVQEIQIENEIAVSEEELTSFYERVFGEQENAPTIDDVRPMIEEALIQEEVFAIIETQIDELRSQADIKINE